MDFFKRFLASCLGSVVGLGFLLFIILFGILGISSSSSISNIEKTKIEENSILGFLNLKKGILNFLQLVENNYNIKPIIYTQQKFYNIYLRNQFHIT